MIKINERGDVVVATGADTYNLGDPEQYRAFLLWLTDPDGAVEIPASLFEIDQACPPAAVEKAERYSVFLSEFADKREKAIAEASRAGADIKSNKKAINKLINSLNDVESI